MQEIERVREEITEIVVDYHLEAEKAVAGKIKHYPSIVEALDKILSVKIDGTTLKRSICKCCEGTGLIGGAGINDCCFVCNGVGKVQTGGTTLKELIEKHLSGEASDDMTLIIPPKIKRRGVIVYEDDPMYEAILSRRDLDSRTLK